MPTPRRHADQAQRQAAYRQRLTAARAQELQVKGLPSLPAIPTLPGGRRWELLRRQALELLKTMHQEMEGYHAQRSDLWQESERGEHMAERIDALQEGITVVEELGA